MDPEKANRWMDLHTLKEFVRKKKLNKTHKPDILLSMNKSNLIEGLKKHGFFQEGVTWAQYIGRLVDNQAQPIPSDLKRYFISNQNEYELTVYVKWVDTTGTYQGMVCMKRWFYVEPFSDQWAFKARDNCEIIIVPQLEVNCSETNESFKTVTYNYLCGRKVLFNMRMGDYPDQNIIIPHTPYQPPKTKEEQWIEAGLKSHYLLQQIIKLGGMKYPNLEPILDMVQDIKLPEHTEHEKERAGIPSGLTNIATIDE